MRHLRPLQFPLLATCVILALGCQFSVGTACPEERMWNAERPSKRLYRLFNSSWHGRTRTGLICLRHSQPYIIKGTRDVSSSSCNIITKTEARSSPRWGTRPLLEQLSINQLVAGLAIKPKIFAYLRGKSLPTPRGMQVD